MSRGTQDTSFRVQLVSVTGLSPSLAGLSRTNSSYLLPFFSFVRTPYNPDVMPSVWALPRFARRYLGNHFCFLFLGVLRCFSSPGLPPTTLYIQMVVLALLASGLPHSEISGSMLTYSSPKHIGVRPVLHRLLAPRHPPCALSSLILLTSYFR